MLKRDQKRKFKTTIYFAVVALSVIFSIVFIVVLIKAIIPILNSDQGTTNIIIKPVASHTRIEELKDKIDEKNIIFDWIKYSSASSDIIGKLRNGPTVFFGATQDANWQINSLVLILAKTRNETKKPNSIDLRSSRPIVKF